MFGLLGRAMGMHRAASVCRLPDPARALTASRDQASRRKTTAWDHRVRTQAVQKR